MAQAFSAVTALSVSKAQFSQTHQRVASPSHRINREDGHSDRIRPSECSLKICENTFNQIYQNILWSAELRCGPVIGLFEVQVTRWILLRYDELRIHQHLTHNLPYWTSDTVNKHPEKLMKPEN